METVWLIVMMVLAASTIYFSILAGRLNDAETAHYETREALIETRQELALTRKECEQAKADRIATENQLNDLSLKYDGLSGMLGRIQDVLDEDDEYEEDEF